jgi:hypothetical protein
MFTLDITQHLQYYVYRLIDPRNGETFYIGKGIGNRVFSHAKGEMDASNDDTSDKLKRIREIRVGGFEVAHVIHRHGMEESTAFEVEAALIDAYPEVTNIMGGHGSDDRGVMHSKQIIERYQAKEIDFQHPVLFITINQTALEKENLYEAVRYAWRIDPAKARKADYVLAVQRGVVIGVFKANAWMEAIPENFPDKPMLSGRWGFVGQEAPPEVVQHYLRTRLPDDMCKRGIANPVRYRL